MAPPTPTFPPACRNRRSRDDPNEKELHRQGSETSPVEPWRTENRDRSQRTEQGRRRSPRDRQALAPPSRGLGREHAAPSTLRPETGYDLPNTHCPLTIAVRFRTPQFRFTQQVGVRTTRRDFRGNRPVLPLPPRRPGNGERVRLHHRVHPFGVFVLRRRASGVEDIRARGKVIDGVRLGVTGQHGIRVGVPVRGADIETGGGKQLLVQGRRSAQSGRSAN